MSTDDEAEGDVAVLRQAIGVLERRDWPGQAMLAALIGELDPPRENEEPG